ncbi:MAG: 50S ribosomal protein L1 [Thermoproteota archaeon]|jgi:Ribosomal protein L1
MSKALQKSETDIEVIRDALKKLENTKKRKFTQSYELIINLSDVDVKKIANKFNLILKLPNKISKDIKVCVFAEKDIAKLAEEASADLIMRRTDLEKLQGNKRELKKIAKKFNFFLSQPDLMPLVGKLLGPYLGSRGKLPQVIYPNSDVAGIIKDLKQSVKIRVKNQPTISCIIGKENDGIEKVAENALYIINEVQKILAGEGRIKSVYIKKTMSDPVRIK